MAEQVNIASLTIDVDDVIKESGRLKKEIDAIKKAQKGFDTTTKEGAESYAVAEVSLKKLTKAYRDNQTFATALEEVNVDLNKTISIENKSTQELYDSRRQLNAVAKNIQGNTEEEIALREKLNKAIDSQTDKLRSQQSTFNKNKDRVGEYKDSILEAVNELRQQQEVLNDTKKALEANLGVIEEGTEEYEDMSKAISLVNSDLENVNKSLEENSSEVEISDFSIQGFIKSTEEAGGASKLLSNGIKSGTKAMGGLIKSSLKFIATPVGFVLAAIAGAFLLIKNAMNRSEESTTKVRTAMSGLTGMLKGVLKILEPLGEFLIEGLVKGFELLEKGINKTLKGLQRALNFLGFENAAEAVGNFTEKIEAAAEANKQLVEAELALQKAQRISRKVQLDYQKDAEKLRQIRDDETKSFEERIEANNKLGATLKKQAKEEEAIIQKAIDLANLRIELEGETTDALNERAEALTELSDIQERIVGQESEQLVNSVSLQKEAADEKRAIQEEFSNLVEADMEAELELFEDMLDDEIELTLAKNEQILQANQELVDKKLEQELERIAQEGEAEQELSALKKAIINELFNFSNVIGDKRIANINSRAKLELNSDKLTAEQKEEIEKRAANEIAKIQRRQAIVDKAQGLFNVGINTATAITKAGAQLGVFAVPAQVALGILGGLQAASIIAQPLPEIPMLASGGMVRGAGTGKSDSIHAMLSNGESVNNANSTRMFAPLYSYLNQLGGGDRFANGGIAGTISSSASASILDYELMAAYIAEAIKSLPAPQVSVEEINTVNSNVEVVENLATG